MCQYLSSIFFMYSIYLFDMCASTYLVYFSCIVYIYLICACQVNEAYSSTPEGSPRPATEHHQIESQSWGGHRNFQLKNVIFMWFVICFFYNGVLDAGFVLVWPFLAVLCLEFAQTYGFKYKFKLHDPFQVYFISCNLKYKYKNKSEKRL